MSYTNREKIHESLITEKSLNVCTSEYRLGTNVSHAIKFCEQEILYSITRKAGKKLDETITGFLPSWAKYKLGIWKTSLDLRQILRILIHDRKYPV